MINSINVIHTAAIIFGLIHYHIIIIIKQDNNMAKKTYTIKIMCLLLIIFNLCGQYTYRFYIWHVLFNNFLEYIQHFIIL